MIVEVDDSDILKTWSSLACTYRSYSDFPRSNVIVQRPPPVTTAHSATHIQESLWTSDADMDRPVTSKPRGICRYYDSPRGCYAGDTCKFLHGPEEKLSPYDKAKVCKFYVQGKQSVFPDPPHLTRFQVIAPGANGVGFVISYRKSPLMTS